MLPSGSKSSDHGNSSQHAEVCVGVSSFHVWVISTCAAFFVSICLSHTVVWVCECFYLLLMFVCSMQPSNIFGRTELSPPIFEQLSSYYLWCEIILGYFKFLHDKEKLLINAHQQDFIQKWPFLQMRACFLVFWFVWFWLFFFYILAPEV